jgi:peptidoglycan-associated lipoprotein
MKKIAAVLASLLVVACASAPKTEVSPGVAPNAKNGAQDSTSSGKADNHAVSSASLASSNTAEKANEAQSAPQASAQKTMANSQDKSVYFEFDSFAILADYRDVLKQQAEFIKAHSNDVFVLEGNADERGSGEYNLALGNKRASAVRKNLVLMGVPASRLKVVSFGKEKPRLTCHEEKCWHENRRVDFVIQQK